ncbi:MAG: FliM/FliN family flagellar motor switch protein [Gammaproteobacteria bacterium]|nr:FliM/FliN family flagellar motor switch protein [Gammaproteobacteria bacterium]
MNGQNTELDPGAPPGDPEQPGQSESPTAVAAEDLPIHLVFVAGELEVPLRDLRRIRPGYVFKLHQPPDRHVVVRANGKTIGRGELVDVDGRVGVRLLDCDDASEG